MGQSILIVDDNHDNLDIVQARLAAHGYKILTAVDGAGAIAAAREQVPDLILLDVMMPGIDGIEVCRQLKSDACLPFIPIIMVTAKSGTQDVVNALSAGADEYLTKPVDHAALVARVKSMLRIKELTDTVLAQSARLAELNANLERRVSEQVAQLERLSRLRRYFSAQVAEAILEGNTSDPLASHRREIVVVFLDLRNFTTFAELSEPEEVMQVLRTFHAEMGKLILRYDGTLERFTGDGMMIFFNDPVVVENAAEQAMRMAVAMRDRVAELSSVWRRRGLDLSLGIGIAQGFATLGAIGFEGRLDYAAIGSVTNLAARLCGEAKGGQILASQKALSEVEHLIVAEPADEVRLKGFSKPIKVFAVAGLRA